MPIVKRSKNWSWQPPPKATYSSFFRNETKRAYIASSLLSSWLGTYLDLYFTGKGWYTFPQRPLAAIFPIHILFATLGLSAFSLLFLFIMTKLQPWQRSLFVVALSFWMALLEAGAEAAGWLIHTSQWSHTYSFIGYWLFINIVWRFFRWMCFW
ncbi:CBO0543 family protein [Anoxybacillus sp. P3H1B]|uniref:CBO0543 family protein n=1 Tax=Anoxybacillus sp. P3H1B TaxID=1769293 RepID=UPI0008262D1F|nr:CBO0543 family protein [Anoxybacillus sp. P3H1B]